MLQHSLMLLMFSSSTPVGFCLNVFNLSSQYLRLSFSQRHQIPVSVYAKRIFLFDANCKDAMKYISDITECFTVHAALLMHLCLERLSLLSKDVNKLKGWFKSCVLDYTENYVASVKG